MIDWKSRAQQLEKEIDKVCADNGALLDDNTQLRLENTTLKEEIQKLRDLLYNRAHHNFEG
jgi:regulator of replication initiation timing